MIHGFSLQQYSPKLHIQEGQENTLKQGKQFDLLKI